MGEIREYSFQELKTVAGGHYEHYGEKTKGFIFVLNWLPFRSELLSKLGLTKYDCAYI